MVTRRATTKDHEAVYEMVTFFANELNVNPAEVINNIKNYITIVFVEEDGGELVGCVGAIKFGDTAIGDFLYVKSARRGGRTARRLMSAIETFMASINCSTFKVVVSPHRQSFYEKFGLEQKFSVMEKEL